MIRSASTLQYQIAKGLVESIGIGEAVGHYEGKQVIDQIRKDGRSGTSVIKCHDFIDEFKNLAEAEDCCFIYSYRDIRDVVVSLMNRDKLSFHKIFTPAFTKTQLENYYAWSGLRRTLISRYEEIVPDLRGEVVRIAEFLQLKPDRSLIERISNDLSLVNQKKRIRETDFEKEGIKQSHITYSKQSLLHRDHIFSGDSGQWETRLSSFQIATIQKKWKNWFLDTDYELHRSVYSYWFFYKFRSLLELIRRKSLYQYIKTRIKKRISAIKTTRIEKRMKRWDAISGKKNGKDYLTCRIYPGIKIRLYKDRKLSRLIYSKAFEVNEVGFLKRILHQGDIFMDIGANVGFFTLIASQLVGEKGFVYSFEPVRETYTILEENIAANRRRNAKPFMLAFSDKKEQHKMMVSTKGWDAYNTLANPSHQEDYTEIMVETDTLDHFVGLHSLQDRIGLIKIDVEGWEVNVLKGGFNYLKSEDAPVLMVEFTEENLRNANTSSEELFNFISDLGYELYRFDAKSNKLEIVFFQSPYEYCNLIAIKNLSILPDSIKPISSK